MAFGSVFNLQISDVRSCVRRWAQIFTDGRMPLECGTGQRLILTNVTYEQQGQYICLASNKINGNVREVKSDPVSLQVVGAPRVRQRLASRRGAAERWKSFAANQNYRGGPTLTDSVSGGPVAKKYRFITLRDPRDHWISFAATEYPREYFARSPSFSFDCPEYRWKKKRRVECSL